MTNDKFAMTNSIVLQHGKSQFAMLQRILEPEVMDTADDAREYDAMDHAAVNTLFVSDLLAAMAGWGRADHRQPMVPSSPQKPTIRILDLGAGTAQIPIELARRAPQVHVTALDAAESMLALARANIAAANLTGRVDVTLADAKRLPFADGAFDVVISNSIVHHIPEPRAVIAEAIRVTTPGGLLVHRDLARPLDEPAVQVLVNTYANDVPGPEQPLPIHATRERQALRLSSLPVTAIGRPGEPPLQAIGPEENGKLRLRSIVLGPDGQRTESWGRLPGRERVDGFRYAVLDGRPVLIVTTSDAEKIGIFAKQRFRLFPLNADRSRSGQPPSLAFESASHRWFPVEPVLRDLDRDGKQDLVVIQPEGLGGGDLMIDTFFGQGKGRFERPRRVKLGNLDSRSWVFGEDVTGDGVPDLVTVSKTGLRVFAGTTDPRRDLLDRRPRETVDLGGAQEMITVALGVGTGGVDMESSRSASLGGPHLADLDADGRPEVLLFTPNDRGRGRVTVVRLRR